MIKAFVMADPLEELLQAVEVSTPWMQGSQPVFGLWTERVRRV